MAHAQLISRSVDHPSPLHPTMTLGDYPPLLRQSRPSPTRQRYMNRTMSLRAALLAFPLPSPPLSSISAQSRAPRPSPLTTYNSNYTRLTQARTSRLQQRQSLYITNNEPVYAMPASYTTIQQQFPNIPAASTSIGSMTVEIDDSSPPFEIFEDPTPKMTSKRLSRRSTLLSSGNIANKQHLRKLSKRKDPKEISVNVLRKTRTFIAKHTRDTLSNTSEGISRIVRKLKNKNIITEGDKGVGDEFHKKIYDLHAGDEDSECESGIFENDDEGNVGNLNVDCEGSFEFKEGVSVIAKDDGVVAKDDRGVLRGHEPVPPGYVAGARRQTWSNLSSILIDDTPTKEPNILPTTVDEAPCLTTIQEIHEISHCGRQQPSPESKAMTGYLQSLALALKTTSPTTTVPSSELDAAPRVSMESANWEMTTESSRAKSLRQLSGKNIFDLTKVSSAATTYYSGLSDPIKPSVTSTTNNNPFSERFAEITVPSQHFESEIITLPRVSLLDQNFEGTAPQESQPLDKHCNTTRPSSSQYSDILPPPPPQQQQGYYASRQLSYSSSLRERPLSDRKISEEVYRHVSNHPSLSDKSIPSWKWDVHAENEKEEKKVEEVNVGIGEVSVEEPNKSVKERVRELDMAIDYGLSFDNNPVKNGLGLFGRWK